MRKAFFVIILFTAFITVMCILFVRMVADRAYQKAKDSEKSFLYNNAEEQYSAALRLNPFCSEYPAGYATFLLKTSSHHHEKAQRITKARSLFQDSLKLNPQNASSWLGLGQTIMAEQAANKKTHLFLSGSQEIFSCFEKAFFYDPRGLKTAYTLGKIYLELWNSLSESQKGFTLERLKYYLTWFPWGHSDIYQKIWKKTHSYQILKKATPDIFICQQNLFHFILQKKELLVFCKEQLDVLNSFKRPRLNARDRKNIKTLLSSKPARNISTQIKEEDWMGFDSTDEAFQSGALYNNGSLFSMISVPENLNSLIINARGQPAKGIYPYMVVSLNGNIIGETFVDSLEGKDYLFSVKPEPGIKVLSISFLNDFYDKNTKEDRNLFIGTARVE